MLIVLLGDHGWETFYISRWDNPTYAKKRYEILPNGRTYEEDLKLSKSDRQYREDILGLPSDEEGTQFPDFRNMATIEATSLQDTTKEEYLEKLRTPNPNYTYSIGYDPAKQIDGAAVVVYCEQTGEIVEMEQYKNMSYVVQINSRIKYLSQKWNNAIVRYGKTGVGEALEPFFIAAGIPYEFYPEQGKNKEKLVENLTILIKNGRFKIYNLDDTAEIAVRQFEDYGYSTTEKGNITYGNITAGGHDDFVSASYFATAEINAFSGDDIIQRYYDVPIPNINNKKITKQMSSCGFF